MGTHHIELISDIESLDLVKEEFGVYSQSMWVSKRGNPLGKEAIFKCKPTTPNEVFGYSLATGLGMPMPRFKGVWLKNSFIHPDGKPRCENAIGLLIEKIVPSQEIYLLGAVEKDTKVSAMNLLMRLFLGEGEHLQILSCDSCMYFYDLEWIGPQMRVGDSEDVLEGNSEMYACDSSKKWEVVLELALEYKIVDEFVSEFKKQDSVLGSTHFKNFSLDGHYQSEMMSKVFSSAVKGRYLACVEYAS